MKYKVTEKIFPVNSRYSGTVVRQHRQAIQLFKKSNMSDWRQEIDALFKSQGFERKIPELSVEDQVAIQEFQENIGKPALENFCDELNSFQNIRAEVVVSKKNAEALVEQVELTVFKLAQAKLTYRLKFLKREGGVHLGSEYSIPNIYGENTRFHNSTLDRLLAGTAEDEIANDFSQILKSKF